MTLVVDASVALAWCFEDEASPNADAVLRSVAVDGASVPPIWRFELANVLVHAERRGRITRAQIQDKLGMIDRLPIFIDLEGGTKAWQETFALARQEKLTIYDAAYLELALRQGATLASKDLELVAAAGRTGVRVTPL